MANGLLMFAKYAFPPNTLQLCGPQKGNSIFEILTDKNPDDNSGELKEALLQFEGAVPYLRLIAQENNIKDIFDERVVEAYWLGNGLLNRVRAKNVYSNIENRFKKAMDKKDWLWLVSGSIPEGKPFHGFHVFDVYRRAGLLRSGNVGRLLETMDKCRITWGKIESFEPVLPSKTRFSFGTTLVRYEPLEFYDGKLRLGESVVQKALLLDCSIRNGDEVSLHWNYVCDKINARQKNNLIYWTNYHLRLTNQTI
ncbi:MAG: DUF6390 family protein [bacterium]|nr:DUF6390 family protein [bacterium]